MTGDDARRQARAAGLLYVAVIVLGAFAEAFVRQRLTVPADAGATLAAIGAHEMLWRTALLADLTMLMGNVAIIAIFTRLFSPVDRLGTLLMVYLTLVQVAMQAAILTLHSVPLLLLHGGPALAAIGAPERAALAYLALRLLATGYNLVLMVFGLFCLVFGRVAWKSQFVPRWICALMALAGLSYLINGLIAWIAPALAPQWLLLLCLAGEVSLALWLMLFGVDPKRWTIASTRHCKAL